MVGAIFFLCIAAIAVDGDTLRCRGEGLVRLARIDAPELPGHFRHNRRCAEGDGKASRDALAAMIAGREVHCRQVEATPFAKGFQARAPYDRIVARCVADGRDLSAELIRRGLAERWPS